MPAHRPPEEFSGEFYTDLAARATYSEGAGPYRIVPDAVAIPRDTDDLVRLVRCAREEGWALVPRGAGSGMPGGNVGRGVLVDLQRFVLPLRVSPARGANVGAAVTWRNLSQAAQRIGCRLPPDPSSGAYCTIGGMAATNAAGARSLRYGSIRGWIDGMELVTADGEVGWLARHGRMDRRPKRGQRKRLVEQLQVQDRFYATVEKVLVDQKAAIMKRFPATTKNSSGYALDEYLQSGDLLDLVVGSEGSLGFITRIETRLDAEPAATAAVLLALADIEALADMVRTLLALEPTVVELLDRTFLEIAAEQDLLRKNVAAVLLVEFERPDAEAARSVMEDAVRQTASWCADVQTALTEQERERLWALRHAASPRLAELPANRRSLQIIEDGCVPVEHLSRYLQGVRDAARMTGLDVVAFGHAGDGHLHVNALVDTTDPSMENRLQGLLYMVTDLIVELRGTLSGEHGDGRLRAALLERTYGPEVTALFKLVKRAFDPTGLCNPGVIVPDADAQAIADLKVGIHTEDIPPHISNGLLSMERRGLWSTPKLHLRGDPGDAAPPPTPTGSGG
jgi:FAD/FMN-containing dehydrogenase